MRILLLHKFHYRLGGAERIYFETARLLEEAGHEVAFFSMRHPKNEETPWQRFFVREVDYDDRRRSLGEKIRTALDILWNREASKKLDKLITEFRPDVAHAFNVFHQLSPAVFHVLERRGVPTVITLCDFKVVSPNYFLYHFGKRHIWESASGFRCILDRAVKNSYLKSTICALELWLHRVLKSYEKAEIFLAPSDFLIGKYHELGFRREIARIHHPVDTKNLELASMAGQTTTAVPDDTYIYFGRLSPEKGVEVAIRALAKIPGAKLLIAGFGPSENELREEARNLGLENRVEFLGPVYGEDVFRIVAQARGVIFPVVWYENQPFALMDALASGVPVIASRIGGLPDVVKHGENGFLFEAGDADDLARVIQEAAALSSEKRQALVQKARITAEAYTPERYRDEILAVYQKLNTKNPDTRSGR